MRFLILFFVLALPLSAYSEDYYWIIGSSNTPQFPSAVAALTHLETQNPTVRFEPYNQTESTWGYRTYRKSDGGYTGFGSINRRGSGCTEPKVLNPATGGCESPPEPNGEVCGPKNEHTGLPKIKNSAGECVDFPFADKPSQCNYAKNKVREVSVYAQFDSNGVPSGPPSIDVGGCVAVPIGPSPYKNCPQPAPRKSCFNGVCIELGASPQNVMFLFNLPALLVTVSLALLVIPMMGSGLVILIRDARPQLHLLKLIASPARTLQMRKVASHVLVLTIRACLVSLITAVALTVLHTTATILKCQPLTVRRSILKLKLSPILTALLPLQKPTFGLMLFAPARTRASP